LVSASQSACSRRLRGWWTLLLLIAAASLACGGGGGGHHSGPAFTCSESAVGVDTVALVCATKISKDIWQLDVVIGGPTTSTDISGFNFDVVFDSSDLSYVPGSAVLGTLLSQGGDDPLLSADPASNDPGRLIVGIHRTNQPQGVGGAGPENLVLSFCLKANMLTAFGPDLVHFENAEAVDSSGTPIAGITFSDQLSLSVH
jgi:hypothetical protein